MTKHSLRLSFALLWVVLGTSALAQQLDTIVYISDTLGGLSNPSQILTNPSTGRVYVAATSGVLVFDPLTLRKERKLPAATNMVCSEEEERIYLARETSLVIVDARTDTVLRTVVLPRVTGGLLYSPRSGLLFLPGNDDGVLRIMTYDVRAESLRRITEMDSSDYFVAAWDSVSDRLLLASSWIGTDTQEYKLIAFDCARESVVGRAVLPFQVLEIALNPLGRRLYCSGENEQLLIVNTDEITEWHTVPGFFSRSRLFYHPGWNRLYASGPVDSVTVWDCAQESIRARVQTGAAVGFASCAYSGRVYVSTDRSGGIAVLGETDTLVGRIGTLTYGEPQVMAVSETRHELYCAMSDDTVIVVEAGPDTVRGYMDYTLYSIRGMVYYPAGNKLYLLLPGNGAVLVLGSRYQELTRLPLGVSGTNVFAVVHPALGRLYVVGDSVLEVFDCVRDLRLTAAKMPGIIRALPLLLPELGKLFLFPAAYTAEPRAFVYDCLRDTIRSVLTLPGDVSSAAYHPWSRRIYLAGRDTAGLLLLGMDPVRESIVSRLWAGRRTGDTRLVAHGGNGRLYLVDNRACVLTVLDVRNDSVVCRVPFPTDADTVFLHTRLGKLYLCHEGPLEGAVYVYDCAGDSIASAVSVNFRHVGLLNELTDRLYLGTPDGLRILDCRYDELTTFLPDIPLPRYAARDEMGNKLYFARRANYFVVYQDRVGAEEDREANTGTVLQLKTNPARGQVRFLCRLPTGQNAELVVRDIAGRMVRKIGLTGRNGDAVVFWDGQDAQGRKAAAGVYFCRLEAKNTIATAKLVLE